MQKFNFSGYLVRVKSFKPIIYQNMNICRFVKFKSPYSKADEKTEKIMFKFHFFFF